MNHPYEPGPGGSQFNYYTNVNNIYLNQGPSTETSTVAKIEKPDSDSEDDESELQPQYMCPPQSRPFISAQAVDKLYTEIQLGVAFYGYSPPAHLCDKCRSKRKDGKLPMVYDCFQCSRKRVRTLCKKCAQKELSDSSAVHKPDHKLWRWQPTWPLDLAAGLQIPMLSPDMENFAHDQIPDDIRSLTFESREYFDDRTIRLFVPSPGGECRIVAKIKVWPIKNERRHQGFFRDLEGKIKDKIKPEIVGSVGMSAYPFSLSPPPIRPRKDVPEEPLGKTKDKSSMSFDIRRNDDFSELRTLTVEVDTGFSPQRAVELLLQDVYDESDDYEEHPFKWTLRSLSITQIPRLAPSFASVAQWELYRRQQREKLQEDREYLQERAQEWSERWQDAQDWHEAQEQKPQASINPIILPIRSHSSNRGDNERRHGEGSPPHRDDGNHLRPNRPQPRPSSMPPRSRHSSPPPPYARPPTGDHHHPPRNPYHPPPHSHHTAYQAKPPRVPPPPPSQPHPTYHPAHPTNLAPPPPASAFSTTGSHTSSSSDGGRNPARSTSRTGGGARSNAGSSASGASTTRRARPRTRGRRRV